MAALWSVEDARASLQSCANVQADVHGLGIAQLVDVARPGIWPLSLGWLSWPPAARRDIEAATMRLCFCASWPIHGIVAGLHKGRSAKRGQ